MDDNNVIFILKIISACPALLPPLDGRADQALLLDEAEHAVHRRLLRLRGRSSPALAVGEVLSAAKEGGWTGMPIEVDGGHARPSSPDGPLTCDAVDAALVHVRCTGQSGKSSIDAEIVEPAETGDESRDSADVNIQRLTKNSPSMDQYTKSSLNSDAKLG